MTAPALEQWIGKTEVRLDQVTLPMAERMAATLDRDDPPPRLGDTLPLGWHSMLFPRIARRSLVGRDGHPKLGDFLPPMPLPRRMFAGRRTQFIADLLLGDEVTCTSVIASITPKAGKSGPMIFLTLRHSIASARGLAIVEEQDVVYREETTGSSGATPAAAKPMDTPRTARWMREHIADEVTLFRYSALTFNGHRIHYDLPYVTTVEGYPGLVVNGGLTTLYIYELLRERAPRPLKSMSTRNLRPMFGNQPFTVCVEPSLDTSGASLWVIDSHGEKSLDGTCEFA
ncbi:MAG: MaoC family dehydratase N-terminal domain-containing protein [Burkholderiales bacterium]